MIESEPFPRLAVSKPFPMERSLSNPVQTIYVFSFHPIKSRDFQLKAKALISFFFNKFQNPEHISRWKYPKINARFEFAAIKLFGNPEKRTV